MVDFQAIGQVMDTSSPLVCMSDNDDLVTSVYEFLEPINISLRDSTGDLTVDNWYIWLSTPPIHIRSIHILRAMDPTRLWIEEVTDHTWEVSQAIDQVLLYSRNVVWHLARS